MFHFLDYLYWIACYCFLLSFGFTFPFFFFFKLSKIFRSLNFLFIHFSCVLQGLKAIILTYVWLQLDCTSVSFFIIIQLRIISTSLLDFFCDPEVISESISSFHLFVNFLVSCFCY